MKLHYKVCKFIYGRTGYSNVRLWWGYYTGEKTPRIADKRMASGFKAVFPAYTLPIIHENAPTAIKESGEL